MTINERFLSNEKLVHKVYNDVIGLSSNWFKNFHGDDVKSSGFIGLYVACQRYDESMAEFSTFAVPYIRGYMLKYIQDQLKSRNKNKINFDYLEDVVSRDGNNTLTLADILPAEEKIDVNWILYDNRLDEKQRKVLKLTYEGYNQRETGEKIGLTQVQISRILKKVRDILQEDYDGTI